jgi:hypothetical protein
LPKILQKQKKKQSKILFSQTNIYKQLSIVLVHMKKFYHKKYIEKNKFIDKKIKNIYIEEKTKQKNKKY